MSTVRLIVTVAVAWILSLALAICALAGIHRVLSARSHQLATRSSAPPGWSPPAHGMHGRL